MPVLIVLNVFGVGCFKVGLVQLWDCRLFCFGTTILVERIRDGK